MMDHARTMGLPGEPAGDKLVDRVLRVDHAGEYGAVRIYEGQLAVLGRDSAAGAAIAHMAGQERRHLDTFEKPRPGSPWVPRPRCWGPRPRWPARSRSRK
jgi:demethoxyubiquinone hydroxylase (CLK1/Coq7/Cat5 family)